MIMQIMTLMNTNLTTRIFKVRKFSSKIVYQLGVYSNYIFSSFKELDKEDNDFDFELEETDEVADSDSSSPVERGPKRAQKRTLSGAGK